MFPAAILRKIPTFIYFIHLLLLLSNSTKVFSPHTSQFSLLFQLGFVFFFPSLNHISLLHPTDDADQSQ